VQPNADQLIAFEISGPGVIAAVGNGDGASEELYQAHQRKLYQGRAQVIVRTSKTPGTIQVEATAPGLTAGQQSIKSTAAE
jgi:beta-galactosidase